MKNIFVINGSAGNNTANQRLIENMVALTKDFFTLSVFDRLKTLPHFDPDRSVSNTPQAIIDVRQAIASADGILICTPEYIFSIPSGLKNVIEWCVSTTVFSGKPTGLITASASGEKGHEALQLIMKTVMADFRPQTTLLIQGIKGKVNERGLITDSKTRDDLLNFIAAFKKLVETNTGEMAG